MLINADYTRVATSLPKQQQWVKSPQKGVERIMLDRVGKACHKLIFRYHATMGRYSTSNPPSNNTTYSTRIRRQLAGFKKTPAINRRHA